MIQKFSEFEKINEKVEEKNYSEEEVKSLLWEARKFYKNYENTPYNKVREPFKEWIKTILKK